MKKNILLLLTLFMAWPVGAATAARKQPHAPAAAPVPAPEPVVTPIKPADPKCPPLLRFQAKPLRGGDPVNFCENFQGKLILAVNTASQCGFTPQFKGLQAIYEAYKDRGLVVLGFPSNDFKQELADPRQIADVCYLNYGVTFPMFAKGAVSGRGANPFFKQLFEQSGLAPQWNFFKYLIGPDGKVIKAYPSRAAPESEELVGAIEMALAPPPLPEEKPANANANHGHGHSHGHCKKKK